MKEVFKKALEKTKNVMSKILGFFKKHKIVTMFITMLLTFCIGLVGNCGGESSVRSPTKVSAYAPQISNSNVYSMYSQVTVAIKQDGVVQQLIAPCFWLNKSNGDFYYPDTVNTYTVFNVRDNITYQNTELYFSLSNGNENVQYLPCTVENVPTGNHTVDDIRFLRFSYSGNRLQLFLCTAITNVVSNRYTVIDFIFSEDIQVVSASTVAIPLMGLPIDISYNLELNGYDNGYDFGYEEGHRIGYNEGVDTTWGDISPFEVLSNSIDDLFDTPLFGSTLKIKHVLQIGFGIILLGFIIKVFLGG